MKAYQRKQAAPSLASGRNADPRAAHAARTTQIHAKLAPLQQLAADHFGHDPDAIHWGHVGDLGRGSDGFRVLHPRRDVALAPQHTPYIGVVGAFDVGDEVVVARQRPGAQVRQIQFMRVAR